MTRPDTSVETDLETTWRALMQCLTVLLEIRNQLWHASPAQVTELAKRATATLRNLQALEAECARLAGLLPPADGNVALDLLDQAGDVADRLTSGIIDDLRHAPVGGSVLSGDTIEEGESDPSGGITEEGESDSLATGSGDPPPPSDSSRTTTVDDDGDAETPRANQTTTGHPSGEPNDGGSGDGRIT